MTRHRGKTLAFNDAGTFQAYYRMKAEMAAGGFSVGSSQGGAPLGILFGDFAIAKWRNLDEQERAQLHGVVEGDRREGPLLVTVFEHAPRAARDAFSAMFRARLQAAYQAAECVVDSAPLPVSRGHQTPEQNPHSANV